MINGKNLHRNSISLILMKTSFNFSQHFELNLLKKRSQITIMYPWVLSSVYFKNNGCILTHDDIYDGEIFLLLFSWVVLCRLNINSLMHSNISTSRDAIDNYISIFFGNPHVKCECIIQNGNIWILNERSTIHKDSQIVSVYMT